MFNVDFKYKILPEHYKVCDGTEDERCQDPFLIIIVIIFIF